MDSELEITPDAFGEILRALPEILLVVRVDGRIRYMNRAGSDRDPQQFIGTTAHEFLPNGSKDIFEEAMQALVATREAQKYEVEVSLPDGFSGWYRVRMLPLDENGEVESALVLGTDVTELKEVEREVAHLRQLLPVCAWCSKIHTEKGSWEPMEDYLERESGTRVSHGICPDCDLAREEELPSRQGGGR